jgi:hypothetical protein
MTQNATICVGTLGQGIWRGAEQRCRSGARKDNVGVDRINGEGPDGDLIHGRVQPLPMLAAVRSSDGGATWLWVRHGLYSESAVRALAVHPSDAHIMYCGFVADSPLEGDGFEPSVPRSPVSSIGAARRSCLRGNGSGSARFLVLS